MIFYLFVSLIDRRHCLIDKNKNCDGQSLELKSQIDQLEKEILKNKKKFFGRLIEDNIKPPVFNN
jgi:hypothetical protein